MNTPTGRTTVSLENPLDKNPPVAADSATGQMLRKQEFMIRYYAKARRYLDDHGRLLHATHEQIESVAEWLRYHEFRRAIEPLERMRNKALGDWFSLQADVHAEQPEWLKEATANFNEIIASIARKDFWLRTYIRLEGADMTKLRFVERRLNPHSGVYSKILQQYGEIEQAPNSTDGEGNPIYDGPTVQGWFDVPLVTEATDQLGRNDGT